MRGHNPKRSRTRKVKNGRSKDVGVLVSMLASVLSGRQVRGGWQWQCRWQWQKRWLKEIRGRNPKRSRMCKAKNGRSKDVGVLALTLASVLSG